MSIIPISDVIGGLSGIPRVFAADGIIETSGPPNTDYGAADQVLGRSVATDQEVAWGESRASTNTDIGDGHPLPSVFEDVLDLAPDAELNAAEENSLRVLGPITLENLRTRGIDALAWYVPFHTKSPEWGIHIPVSSIAIFAREAFSTVTADATVRWKLALRAMHQHELNHFAVEYFTAIWELLHGERTFFPSQHRLYDQRLGFIVSEERLANAQMIRAIRSGGEFSGVRGKTQGLHAFIRRQPKGYCHARHSTSEPKFQKLIDRVLRDRISSTKAYSEARHRVMMLRTLVDGFPQVDWKFCPIHIHNDTWHHGVHGPIAWFIHRIEPSIDEPPNFARQLERLDASIVKRWTKQKSLLLQSTASHGLDFKKWPSGGRGMYSVRVTGGYRAHIRFQATSMPWIAEKIGNHKEMGHG
jgi:hypothetical protein